MRLCSWRIIGLGLEGCLSLSAERTMLRTGSREIKTVTARRISRRDLL